ncbi:hypothetical protein CVT26_010449 [Gymnopilus dilepis]|uniref:Uncharacterized protein n=1 Tax=Gymnopilus dilepis TaxID=231916 RepID=A0A409Y0J8_9AGAR|nr:hypothetical protein CVT26_010449 [Gymnopilus dilepis]
MVSPRESRSQRAGRPQQPHGSESGQQTTIDSHIQPLVGNSNLPASSQDQPSPERAKRRKYSASPGPVTPTRLRSHIKETERGQHLANATEHRRRIHEQLLEFLETQPAGTAQEGSTSLEKSSKEDPIPPSIAPAPCPPQVVAPSIPAQFQGCMSFGKENLVFHPKLGWFPFPALFARESRIVNSRAASRAPDIPTEHTQQPGGRRSSTPGYVPLGDPTTAAPFEHELRSPSRQSPPNLPTEDTHQSGSRVSQTPDYIPPGESTLAAPVEHELRASSRQRSVARSEATPSPTEHDAAGQRSGRDEAMAIAASASYDTLRADPVPLRAPEDSECLAVSDPPEVEHSTTRPLTSGSSPSSSSQGSGHVPAGRLDALNAHLTEISNSTGLSKGDIINQMGIRDVQAIDFFNMYRSYFNSRVQEELNRIPDPELPKKLNVFLGGTVEISDSIIEKAFIQFKEANSQYKSFLLDRWSISCIAARDCHRHHQFQEFVGKLESISTFASESLQFETAACAVGSDIHKDQNLSATICSPMVPEFFAERLCVTQSEITGHMKAHAYDCVSRRSQPRIPHPVPDQQDASRTGDDITVEMENAGGARKRARSVSNPLLLEEIGVARGQSVDSDKERKVKDGAVVQELKQRLLELTRSCDIDQLKTKIHLTKLPTILSKRGLVIENWPEDVPFACDCHTGKGVAGLSVDEQIALLKSLKDPDHPLRIVRKSSTGELAKDHIGYLSDIVYDIPAIPQSEPVIIGVPPSPGSQFTHGRRRFLDAAKTCDRNGPPRLTTPANQSSVAGPSEVYDKSGCGGPAQFNSRKRSLSRNEPMEEAPAKKVKTEQRMTLEGEVPGLEDSLDTHKLDPRVAGQQAVPTFSITGDDEPLAYRPEYMSPQASKPQAQLGGSHKQIPSSSAAHTDNIGPNLQRGPSDALPFVRFNGSQASTLQPNQLPPVNRLTYFASMPRRSQSPGSSGSGVYNHQMGAQYDLGSGTNHVDDAHR